MERKNGIFYEKMEELEDINTWIYNVRIYLGEERKG